MTRYRLVFAALVCAAIPLPVFAQGALRTAGTDAPARPRAISGAPSSARHCVSADAANVHSLGWVEAGTGYTVTFDSEIALVAAASRLDLDGERSNSSYGTPELRFTSSTPGSMALFVSGNGQAGCYRYKVDITPPAASMAPAMAARRTAKASVPLVNPLAISGFASSAKHCVAGEYVANVHEIGRIEQGNQVTITFESDFDPIAGMTNVNLQTQRGTFLVDDDSGGSLQPRIAFTASQAGTMALFVAGSNGRVGCYRYKVEIR